VVLGKLIHLKISLEKHPQGIGFQIANFLGISMAIRYPTLKQRELILS
jgi:hypothetical protein